MGSSAAGTAGLERALVRSILFRHLRHQAGVALCDRIPMLHEDGSVQIARRIDDITKGNDFCAEPFKRTKASACGRGLDTPALFLFLSPISIVRFSTWNLVCEWCAKCSKPAQTPQTKLNSPRP